MLDQVLAAIRSAGYRSADLHPKRCAPFRLAEEDAVRLGLLFAAAIVKAAATPLQPRHL